jgi:hypothetical protein
MKISTLYALVTFIAVIIITIGCSKDDDMEEDQMESCPDEVTFDNQVRPILVVNCANSGCHDGNSGLGDWSSYTSIAPTFSNGRFNNLVIETRQMPQGRSLSSRDYDLLVCWSEQGFPRN